MELARDIRHATRRLFRRPILPIGAVLAMSIGLGGAIAVLRVIDAALVAPLEFRNGDSVLVLSESRAVGNPVNTVSADELQQLASADAPLMATAFFTVEEATMTSPGEPTTIRSARVSPAFFQVFDVPLVAGRPLRDDDIAGRFGAVAVVSERFWNQHFSGQPLNGQHITFDATPVTVVGIVPRRFGFPRGAEVWMAAPSSYTSPGRLHYLNVVARLKPAASEEAVSAYMTVVNQRVAASSTADTHTLRLTSLRSATLGSTRDTLLLIGAAVVVLLLLTACSVANLLVARAWGRRSEYALMVTLGASRRRLLVEPLFESLMLAVPASVLSLCFAHAALRAFQLLAADTLPSVTDASLDLRSTAVAMVLACVFAFGAAVVPALLVARHAGLSGGGMVILGMRRQRLPHALVAAQVALALVLATGALLFAKSLYLTSRVDTGIAVDETVTWRLALPATRYRAAAIPQFYQSAFERLGALSQVRSVSAALVVPFTGTQGRRTVAKDGDAATKLPISSNTVAPNYFSTLGIRLLSGRDFTEAEAASGTGLAIVSASLARAVFGSVDVLGRELVFDDNFGRSTSTIIAVASDTKTTRTTGDPELRAYTPGLRSPRMALTVRLHRPPHVADLQALQTVIRGLDPQVPAEFVPMNQLLFDEISLPAFRAGLLIAFGTQAVLVAAISMLGLIRWRVSQRIPELALRVALGATPANLRRVLVTSELGWVLGGITAGALAIVILMPMARSMLTFVQPLDLTILISAVAILTAIALVSVLPPAARIAQNMRGPLAAVRDLQAR